MVTVSIHELLQDSSLLNTRTTMQLDEWPWIRWKCKVQMMSQL